MHTALHQSKGFTLIEVLLAMAITTFVAVIAYSALSTAITTAERHELKARRLAAVQLALTVLERDIRHTVARAITDEYGDSQPALSGGAQQQYLLMLTRRGWDNPADSRRSELQRLRYQLEGEQLWREHWLVLDRVSEEDGRERVMVIDGIENFEINFLKPAQQKGAGGELGGNWQSSWSDEDGQLPLAVEIVMTLENFGELRRLYQIAGAGAGGAVQ